MRFERNKSTAAAAGRIGRKFLSALLAVLFVVSMLPAGAIADASDQPTFCGKEEHTHVDACYARVPVCGMEEGEGAHRHTDDCYTVERVLSCNREESGEHTHTEECYTTRKVLTCALAESEGHVHTDDCYARELICGKEEHTHSLACCSDRTADVEAPYQWEKSVAAAQLNGDWRHDFLEIAKTQLGYSESDRNYLVTEGGEKRGYTRYGAWYGRGDLCYSEWCAAFVSFCLSYAHIDSIPKSLSVPAWITSLSEAGLYRSASEYTPRPGDIIFFTNEAYSFKKPAHVGIVAEVTETEIVTIEGNHTNTVAYFRYDPHDISIFGFGELPQNPNQTAPGHGAVADYVFPQAEVLLKDILAAAGKTADVGATLSADSALIAFSDTTVTEENYDALTLTALGSFELATLTIEKTGSRTRRITLSYTAPEKPQAPAEIEYTFADEYDFVQLLNLLSANGIETQSIDGVTVEEGDEADIEILYQIGDYTIVPVNFFDRIVLAATTHEGGVVRIVLHFPVTVEADMPEALADTTLKITGDIPADATVAVEPMEAPEAVVSDAVLLSVDVTIGANDGSAYQPAEPVLVTVTDPAFAALEDGEKLFALHTADDGELEPLEIVSHEGDAVVFRADHFSQITLMKSAYVELFSWEDDLYELGLYGYNIVKPTYTEVTEVPSLERGLALVRGCEITYAQTATKARSASELAVVMTKNNIAQDARESTALYSLRGGEVLVEDPALDTQIGLGDAAGFALVRDTGFRNQTLEIGNVTLEGMLPKDAEATATDETEAVTFEEETVLAAYDISITENGADYQPDEAHPVRVQIAVGGLSADQAISVRHIKDDGSFDIIEGDDLTVDLENGTVSFTAPGFSVYAVLNDPNGQPRRWYYFQYQVGGTYYPFNFSTLNNTETQINYQIIHNGDYLKNPGIPQDANLSGSFLGWYLKRSGSGTEAAPYTYLTQSASYTPREEDRINFFETEGHQIYGPITDIGGSNEDVYIVAFFADTHVVTYMDETGTSIVRTEVVEDGTTIPLTRDTTTVHYTVYTPAHATDVFLGWSTVSGATSVSAETMNVTADTVLYPVIAKAKWIVFYTGPSGSGAEYIGDQHVSVAEPLTASSLKVPTYPGYTFDGWYAEASLSTRIARNNNGTCVIDNDRTVNIDGQLAYTTHNNGIYLDENFTGDKITLYAKWAASSGTNYTVQFWAQKSSDSVGLADSAKEYDYLGAVTRTATTGTTVSTTNNDRNLTNTSVGGIAAIGAYFTYNGNLSDASATVKGDGSTVLNVYYDRKTITINFYVGQIDNTTYDTTITVGSYNYRAWALSGYPHWGSDGSSYFPLTLSSSSGTYYTGSSNRYVLQSDEKWTKPDGTTYSDTIYTTDDYSGSNAYNIYTLQGLYGAKLTGWPHTDGKAWSYSINGTTWQLSLPWSQFIISPTPTNGTTTWTVWQITSGSGVGIHYMGETMNVSNPESPVNTTGLDLSTATGQGYYYIRQQYNGTYYENFTMNPYNYYGKYDVAANVTDAEKAQYAAVTGKIWTKKYASDLTYDEELGSDTMTSSSRVYPDDSLFSGYELVGYRYGNGAWHSITAAQGSANGIPLSTSGESGDLYIYYARVRYTLDIYSEFNAQNPSHYKIAYDLDLAPIKDWDVIAGVPHEGRYFGGWYWDSAFTEPVDWEHDNVHVPAHGTSVYAHWKTKEYVIELDFNGGTTQTRQDTVFWLDHGQIISEYANTKRDYLLWDSLDPVTQGRITSIPKYRYHHFIYVNDAGDGYVTVDGVERPGAFDTETQNAFYGTLHEGVEVSNDSTWYAPKKAEYYAVQSGQENTVQTYWDRHGTDENGYPVSAASLDLTYYDNGLYINISEANAADSGLDMPSYRLVGWYEVLDKATGRLSDYPFEYSEQIKRNITLRAVWIRSGAYTVEYNYIDSSNDNRGFYETISGGRQYYKEENGTRTYYTDDTYTTQTTTPADSKKYSDQALVVVPHASSDNAGHFIGWRINGRVYYPGDTFRLDSIYDPLVDGLYNQIIVLEAIYGTIDKSSITFDGNGGTYTGSVLGETGALRVTISGITENSTVTTPAAADFARRNYRLIGWSTERKTEDAFDPATNPGDFNCGQPVAINDAENVLYAVWEPTYSITYHPNNGGGTLTDPAGLINNNDGTFSHVGIVRNTTVTLSDGTGFTREGYTLLGWSTVQGRTADAFDASSATDYALGGSFSVTTENVILYAVWKAQYSITYDLNRGSMDPVPSYLVDNGSGQLTTGLVYSLNENVALLSGSGITRAGYVLLGWSTVQGRTAADFNTSSASDYVLGGTYTIVDTADHNRTFYAVWQRMLSITYHPNGGTGTLSDGGSAVYGGSTHTLTPAGNVVSGIPTGSSVTLSNGTGFTRAGYTLSGWNTAADGTGTYYTLSAVLTLNEDMILYAVWAPKLAIIYDTNGGVGALNGLAAVAGQTGQYTTGNVYTAGQTGITLHNGILDNGTALTRSGYRLMGWNTAADGSGTHYALSATGYTMPGDNATINAGGVTLYAEWVRLYEIQYYPNGGTGDLQNGGSYTWTYNGVTETNTLTVQEGNVVINIPEGSSVTLSTGAGFIRYGLGVVGWSTTPKNASEFNPTTNTTTDFRTQGTITLPDGLLPAGQHTLNLYAVWDTAYSVTYDTRGGTWTDPSPYYTVGTGEGGALTYTITHPANTTFSAPTDPTKDDGEFAFWSIYSDAHADDASAAFDFTQVYNVDLTLYAIYRSTATVTFDLNHISGTTTWTDPNTGAGQRYQQVTANRLYTQKVTIYGHADRPTDPTNSSLMFIGWVTADVFTALGNKPRNTTDWSGTTSGVTGGSTGYVNDLDYIRDHLYAFATTPVPPAGVTLYAVWAETVTVTFNLRYSWTNDNSSHNWTDSTDNTYYVRTSTTPLQYTVTLPKGSKVVQPSNPTQNSDMDSSYTFLAWVHSDYEYYYSYAYSGSYHATYTWSYPSEITPFNFGSLILEDTVLYTSWSSTAVEKTFTVTVNKTLTDPYGLGDMSEAFKFTYTINTYRYERNLNNNTTSGPVLFRSTSSTSELTNGQNHIETLRYWTDYTAEYAYFYYQTIEIAEDVDTNRYTLTFSGNGTTPTSQLNVRVVDLFNGKINYSGRETRSSRYYYYWRYNSGSYYFSTGSWYTYSSGWFNSGYSSTSDNPISNQSTTFTNTRKYVNVTIGKTVVDDPENPAEIGTFSFTATLKDNDVDRTSALAAGDRTFTLAGGQTKTISLPVGSYLTVTETQENLSGGGIGNVRNYNTTAAVTSGTAADFVYNNYQFQMTVPTSAATVTVTNTQRPAGVPVTVSKTVVDPLNAGENFTFTAVILRPDGNPEQYYDTVAGVVKTQAYYEANPTTTTNQDGEIVLSTAVTNGWTTTFKAPPSDELVILESGTGSVDVTNYLTTASATGFTGSLTGKTYRGEVPATAGSITLTNTRRNATVTVSKMFSGGTAADLTRSFTFEVTLYYGTNTPITGFNVLTGAANQSAGTNVTDSTGKTTVTVTGAGTAELHLPIGAYVSVTETGLDTNMYAVSGTGGLNGSGWTANNTVYTSSALTRRGDSITFTNTHKTVTVTVHKTLDELVQELNTGSASFTLTAKLTDGGLDVAGYTINGANATNASGEFVFHLGGGDTIVLTVPYGASLQVTEQPYRQRFLTGIFEACPYNTAHKDSSAESYTNGNTHPYSNVTANQAIDFKNTRKVVTVTVNKETVDPLNPNRRFTFEGTVSTMAGIPIDGWNVVAGRMAEAGDPEENVTNEEGYVHFTLADGEHKDLLLPAGVLLNGAEANANMYDTRIRYAGVNIDATMAAEITFNAANYGLGADWLPLSVTNGVLWNHTIANGIDPVTIEGNNKAYTSEIPPWDCEVWFRNTKPFLAINVTKDLTDPLSTTAATAKTFTFKLEIKDQSGNPVLLGSEGDTSITWYVDTTTGFPCASTDAGAVETTLTLAADRLSGTFTITGVQNGTAGRVTQTLCLPKGANLTITEIDPSTGSADPTFATQVEYTSDATHTHYATNAATISNIQNATGVIFYNRRLTTQVRILKVNSRGMLLEGATFTLSGGALPAAEYGGSTLSTTGSSVVYEGTLWRGQTITLSETPPQFYNADGGGTVQITVAADGSVTSVPAPYGGAAEYDNGTYVLKLKNARIQKTVTVEKTLVDILASSGSFAFTATLTETADGSPLENYPIGGTGVTTDANGQFTFTIDTATATTKALTVPMGTTLTVTEDLTENQGRIYNTTATMHSSSGSVTDAAAFDVAHSSYTENTRTAVFARILDNVTAAYTNTRKTDSLFIQKTLNDVTASSDRTFTFLVELFATDGTTALVDYDANGFTDGVKTVTIALQNGETESPNVTIPIGCYAKVTEQLTAAQAADYNTTIVGALSATITDPSVTNRAIAATQYNTQGVIAFTNTRKSHTITVVKAIDGLDDNAIFTFTAEVRSGGAPAPYNINGFSGGSMTFTLSGGLSKALIVPDGTQLVITEAAYGEPYVLTSIVGKDGEDNDLGTATVGTRTYSIASIGEDGTVTFTNKNAPLTVTKTVTGEMADMAKPFTFTLDGLTAGRTYYYTESGVAKSIELGAGETSLTFTLRHEDTMTIVLWQGHTYTLTETDYSGEGYRTSVAKNGGAATDARTLTFTADGATAVAFENNLPAVAPTGFISEKKPFVWMTAIGTGLLALLVLPIVLRRRKEDEDEPQNRAERRAEARSNGPPGPGTPRIRAPIPAGRICAGVPPKPRGTTAPRTCETARADTLPKLRYKRTRAGTLWKDLRRILRDVIRARTRGDPTKIPKSREGPTKKSPLLEGR